MTDEQGRIRRVRRVLRRPAGRWRITGAAALALLIGSAVAFSTGGDDGPRDVSATMAKAIGPGEGRLTLIAAPGFVERGAMDTRADWITPFEERTKCKVDLKDADSPADLATAMSKPSRRYDGALVPLEVAGQLTEGGHVASVNIDLIDGHKSLEPRLRALLKDGDDVFGVPYAWGTNLLMHDPAVVQPALAGRASIFAPEATTAYDGRILMRDDPLVIAEAAMYLRSVRGRNKSLKIKDPYSLDREQLAAAVEVLTEQRPHVAAYWRQAPDAVGPFASGKVAVGQVWPYHVDVLTRAGRNLTAVAPQEGVTGWVNAWMIGARAQNPNCMYQWLKWASSPDVQQQMAEWNGVAPANREACAGDRLKAAFCAHYHVGDRDYLERVAFARAADDECDDCTGYADWAAAWNRIRR